MQRWITIILGLGVVALVVAVTIKSTPHVPAAATTEHADAATVLTAATTDAGLAATAPSPSTLDAGLALAPELPLLDLGGDAPREGGAALPAGSPRSVRFGVILV